MKIQKTKFKNYLEKFEKEDDVVGLSCQSQDCPIFRYLNKGANIWKIKI